MEFQALIRVFLVQSYKIGSFLANLEKPQRSRVLNSSRNVIFWEMKNTRNYIFSSSRLFGKMSNFEIAAILGKGFAQAHVPKFIRMKNSWGLRVSGLLVWYWKTYKEMSQSWTPWQDQGNWGKMKSIPVLPPIQPRDDCKHQRGKKSTSTKKLLKN